MQWIRCNVCGDLKQEVEYYKNGDGRRKTCKQCMKNKYSIDKENKKEYDRERYLKKKQEKKENRHICMRCGKYYVNVKNGELEWCFHCLQHYEKVYSQKIKVEVIMPYARKVKTEKN